MFAWPLEKAIGNMTTMASLLPNRFLRRLGHNAKARMDGWSNVLTGLGYYGRDKRLGAVVTVAPHLTEVELSELYSGDGLARRICELPANEQTRKWISVTSDDDAETGKKVLQSLQELNAQAAVREAIVWARLYGGAVIILGADDGRRPFEPLKENRLRSLNWLTVLDRHALEVKSTYDHPGRAKHGQAEVYEILSSSTVSASIPVEDRLIHESRVLRFDGPLTSRLRRMANQGWNDSVFTAIYAQLRDVGSAYGGIAHLLNDFSQAVFKIKGLADLMERGESKVVLARLQALDLARSVVRAVAIDEDEDFERKATPTGGLPELADRIVSMLSAVTGIPVTLLMGQAPSGLNATGDSDIRLFYDNISAQQESALRPRLEKLLRYLFLAKQGPAGGREPSNWSFAFNPLSQLTELEQAGLRNKQAQTDQVYISEGVVAAEEVRMSRFGGDAYSPETTLDQDLSPSNEQLDAGADDVPPSSPESNDPAATEPTVAAQDD